MVEKIMGTNIKLIVKKINENIQGLKEFEKAMYQDASAMSFR